MHRIIRVYSLLAVLLDPIVHVFLENTVYGVYTVHRIIRVYSMLSKVKGPYGATMFGTHVPWECMLDMAYLVVGYHIVRRHSIAPAPHACSGTCQLQTNCLKA